MVAKQAIEERFWKYVPDQPGIDCWYWTGYVDKKRGYGSVKVGGRTIGAHRIAYLLCCGDPGGLLVCHACDNPPCVNPSHLWLGDDAANIRDRDEKGRTRSSTHCLRGHPLDEENTYVAPKDGSRSCRICRRDNAKRFYRSHRGAASTMSY